LKTISLTRQREKVQPITVSKAWKFCVEKKVQYLSTKKS